jgi:23S rRNA pseudouridine1911/1915/1917 synthase
MKPRKSDQDDFETKLVIVSERTPEPARRLVAVVARALACHKKEAEALVRDGAVSVNGYPLRQTWYIAEPGARVEILLPEKKVARGPLRGSGNEKVDIVYEDESIVIINKPPGLLTVPTPRQELHTAIGRLRSLFSERRNGEEAHVVHRLDRGVSGLLVFGKSLEISMALRDQFEERKPKRRYLAIVVGQPEELQGTFQSNMLTTKSLMRRSAREGEEGELAITHYKVKQTIGNVSVLEVRLETGRRNQIRVHMAEAGHPIVGDPWYQAELAAHPRWVWKRMGLHAEELGFRHPVTGKTLHFEAPWPKEFSAFLHDVSAAEKRKQKKAETPLQRSPSGRQHKPIRHRKR